MKQLPALVGSKVYTSLWEEEVKGINPMQDRALKSASDRKTTAGKSAEADREV